jgi:hypothetical protein
VISGRDVVTGLKPVLVLGLLVAVVYGFQWSYVYSPERDRLARSHESAQADLRKAQSTAERWPEFVGEYLKRERELAELRRKLPSVSRIPAFVGQAERLLEELGVQGELRSRPSSEAFDFYWRHRFAWTLSGPESAVSALRHRIQEEWPLVVWVDEGETSGGVNVSLLLWSGSESDGSYESPCPVRGEPWLLWPYSKRISELREELRATCTRVEQSRELLEQLSRFEAVSVDVERAQTIIGHLERDAPRAGSGEESGLDRSDPPGHDHPRDRP